MNARIAGNVFAHVLDPRAHQHYGIQCRPAALGREGGVRRDPMEQKFCGGNSQRAAVGDGIAIGRMPVQHHIDVAKQPGPHHVDLAIAALLGGRAVIAQRPCDAMRLHVFFQRHRG